MGRQSWRTASNAARPWSTRPCAGGKVLRISGARRCGEMADAQDLKSWDRKKSCRFESDHRHQFQLREHHEIPVCGSRGTSIFQLCKNSALTRQLLAISSEPASFFSRLRERLTKAPHFHNLQCFHLLIASRRKSSCARRHRRHTRAIHRSR
jgi:hypothetical protein